MTPYFEHDCPKCTYVGSGTYEGEPVDVYESCEASSYTHILRFSSDGSDYMTTDRLQSEVVYTKTMEERVATLERELDALKNAVQFSNLISRKLR